MSHSKRAQARRTRRGHLTKSQRENMSHQKFRTAQGLSRKQQDEAERIAQEVALRRQMRIDCDV